MIKSIRKGLALTAAIIGLNACEVPSSHYVTIDEGEAFETRTTLRQNNAFDIRLENLPGKFRIRTEEPAPLLQDIDGDGRNDIVYIVNRLHYRECNNQGGRYNWPLQRMDYSLRFRKNLGDGSFAQEQEFFLYDGHNRGPQGFQTLFEELYCPNQEMIRESR